MLQALSWLTIVQHHATGGWALFTLHRHYRRHCEPLLPSLAHFEFKESEEIRLVVLFSLVVLFAPTLSSIPPSSQSQFCCRVPAP